jgi:hypothetical protein
MRERARGADGDPNRIGHRQWTLPLDQGLHGAALEQLEHHDLVGRVLEVVEDLRHVGVCQARLEPRAQAKSLLVQPFVPPGGLGAATAAAAYDPSNTAPLAALASLTFCPAVETVALQTTFPVCAQPALPSPLPAPVIVAADDDAGFAGASNATRIRTRANATSAAAGAACGGCPPATFTDFATGACVRCPLAPSFSELSVPVLILFAYFVAIAAALAAIAAALFAAVGAPALHGALNALFVAGLAVPMLQTAVQTGSSTGPFLPASFTAFIALLQPLVIVGVTLPPACAGAPFQSEYACFAAAAAVAVALAAVEAAHCRRAACACAAGAWRAAPWAWAARGDDGDGGGGGDGDTVVAAAADGSPGGNKPAPTTLHLPPPPPPPPPLWLKQAGVVLVAALIALAPITVRMALGVLACKTVTLPAVDAEVLFAWNRRQPYPSPATLAALAATFPPPVAVLVNVAQPFYV